MSEEGGSLLSLRAWSLVRETPDGPRPVLQDLDLELRRGERLGLLGANGSGKTSLLRWLAGEESPLRGRAALVFQDPDEQLAAASVAEELTLGRPGLDPAPLLAAHGLAPLADRDPRLLSAGEKQRLAVAVALAGEPRVLLCDEPTSLQDAAQIAWLRERLDRWRRETGGSLIWATQRRDEAAACDRLLLLRDGRVAATGTADAVLARPEVAELLAPLSPPLSPPSPPPQPDACAPAGPLAAAWRGVGFRFPDGGGFRDVQLEIRPGDRLAIVGPNGCGKSTLLALAVGLLAPAEGRCELVGRPLCRRAVPDLDHGAALLAPQFPEYLFTRTSVAAEIALDPALAGRGEAVLAAAGLPPAAAADNPHALSSGQRRRLAVALTVLSARPVVLLDEPTAGLDRDGRRRLLGLLARLPASSALVIASHDAEFLRACGCRLYELGAGGLRARGGGADGVPLARGAPPG